MRANTTSAGANTANTGKGNSARAATETTNANASKAREFGKDSAEHTESPSAEITNPTSNSNAKELGAFLRAHRELRSPRDVGLPDGGRRRTPGLRREEVAALSGVGLAWYTWLEQGRVTASRKVLEAVARALGLDSVSYRHVLALSGLLPPAVDGAGHDAVAVRTQALLDTWPTSPALLLDARFDITAWNAAYAALWSDPAELPPSRRNLMWCMAGDPAVRTALVDWEPVGRAVLAQFRAQTARLATTDPRTRELYRILGEDFPELAGWWQCQGVGDLTARQVELRLPDHGRLRLSYSAFRPVDDPEALVLVQAPVDAADQALVSRLVRERAARGAGAEVVDIRARPAAPAAVSPVPVAEGERDSA